MNDGNYKCVATQVHCLDDIWGGVGIEDVRARDIDTFLFGQIGKLKREYARSGNPEVIYLAGMELTRRVSEFSNSRFSFQCARLQALLAEMLIAEGRDAVKLNLAVHHIHVALEILRSVDVVDAETIRTWVFCEMLLAVARKALGRPDDALNGIEQASRRLREKLSASELNLMPLRRQQIIMLQKESGHRELAETAVGYRHHDPVGYFGSLKRVFEFLLNRHKTDEAQGLLAEFNRAYLAVQKRIPPISHVSFLKNVGHLQLQAGRRDNAWALLSRASSEAQARNLVGQVRQIQYLLSELGGGNSKGTLITLVVV